MKKVFTEADFLPVEITNDIDPRIIIKPMYFELGFSPCAKIYARQAVLTGMLQALAYLPEHLGLMVFDIYRPRAVQATIFNWMSDQIKKSSPQLSAEENYQETRKYAALPSVVGEPDCAPHLSGGAVDLTIYELATGNECDMGTLFDDCTERAHRNFFDRQPRLSADEQAIKARRELFQTAMEMAGFTSYEYEWWHYDMGDKFWARMTGEAEIFGPLFGDNEWPE